MTLPQNLTALAVVLSAAVLCGLAMNRLRLPAAAGFILAGVVLGPTGFGLIERSDAIETLAELGVLMLLFIIGMELKLQAFRALLPLAVGITLVQIVVAGAFALFAAQFTSAPTASVLVIGFMLAISSTAIAMKMIEDADEKNTDAGKLAVAVLIAQDFAVVPLLLFTDAMGSREHTTIFITLKLLIAVALLAGFIALLSRVKSFRFPFADFFLRDPDIGTLTVLGLCFVAAAISGLIGLSPALGAFLCGLAVGHSTLRPAAVRSAPPVQSILLFTFFLSVGLLLDLHYVMSEFWLILIALAVVAAGKTVVNIVILRLFQQPGDVAFRTALFLTPIGEFSFVLAAAAAASGVLSGEGHKLAIAVIALSLLVSPIWFVGARRAHILAMRGITGANELFRGSYRRELSALQTWGRRATDISSKAAGKAAEAYRARQAQRRETAQVHDEPWGEVNVPRRPMPDSTIEPEAGAPPRRPDPDE
jgi:monovalent cation:H+ antiporter-2, CPA2 family